MKNKYLYSLFSFQAKLSCLRPHLILSLLIILSLITNVNLAHAANLKAKKKVKPPTTSSVTQTSLVVDGKTGQVLHAINAHKKIYPASLTKVMTLYLLFEALESGKLNLNDQLSVSKYATEAQPSKLYLKAGETISVHNAINGLIIKSANDVARVVAENIAKSNERFAKLMTIRAKQLGMHNTNFTNPSGWHHPKQHTTPVDLAKLAIAIKRDFPQYYHYFNKTHFKYKGKIIKGHNQLTASYPGAEGLKTGFHTPAGCCLITAATRNNKSLIGIVTGSKSAKIRDAKMVGLLDKHFAEKSVTHTSKNIKNKKNKLKQQKTRKITSEKSKNTPKNTRDSKI